MDRNSTDTWRAKTDWPTR